MPLQPVTFHSKNVYRTLLPANFTSCIH